MRFKHQQTELGGHILTMSPEDRYCKLNSECNACWMNRVDVGAPLSMGSLGSESWELTQKYPRFQIAGDIIFVYIYIYYKSKSYAYNILQVLREITISVNYSKSRESCPFEQWSKLPAIPLHWLVKRISHDGLWQSPIYRIV